MEMDSSDFDNWLQNMDANSNDMDMDDAMFIPHSGPRLDMVADKTKTRAETQIRMTMTLDPATDVDWIKFPRKTLAKPKQYATPDEMRENERSGRVLCMDVSLVCHAAVESDEGRERALRRAVGLEERAVRPEGVQIADVRREDPAHPVNGGEIIICEGCKQREKKRYDRKKKKEVDEPEFAQHENDRVVMINEKEFKKLKDLDLLVGDFSPRAKQLEFNMRIACYCRHQGEKTPSGYRVIFTLKDLNNAVVLQHMTDVFHITDDHKNKESPVESPVSVLAMDHRIPAHQMNPRVSPPLMDPRVPAPQMNHRVSPPLMDPRISPSQMGHRVSPPQLDPRINPHPLDPRIFPPQRISPPQIDPRISPPHIDPHISAPQMEYPVSAPQIEHHTPVAPVPPVPSMEQQNWTVQDPQPYTPQYFQPAPGGLLDTHFFSMAQQNLNNLQNHQSHPNQQSQQNQPNQQNQQNQQSQYPHHPFSHFMHFRRW